MDHVVFWSKLQSVIVAQLVDEGEIRSGLHLVQLRKHLTDNSGEDVAHQIRRLAPVTSKHTFVARYRVGFPGLFLYFVYLLLRCRLRGDRLFFSNINWYAFALALKCVPGQRINTFDDGTANVQVRNNSYLSEEPSRMPGVRGWIARTLFPKGPAHFTRSRIERHYTIYPGLPNIAPDSCLHVVNLDWSRLIAAEDAAALPAVANRISLGTVYDEINRRLAVPVTEQDAELAIAWSDLHIPHPRQATRQSRLPAIVKYPAEAIISHYAKWGTVLVAHYNSSASLSFRNDPRVRLFDLMALAPMSSDTAAPDPETGMPTAARTGVNEFL